MRKNYVPEFQGNLLNFLNEILLNIRQMPEGWRTSVILNLQNVDGD